MAVYCSYCGEELLGAVNRCWRCGHLFRHAPTASSEPPVLRPPIPGPLDARPDEPVVAAIVGTTMEEASSPVPSPGLPSTGLGRLRIVDRSDACHIGSPFIDDFRPRFGERVRIWAAIPATWWRDLRGAWRESRVRSAKSAAQRADMVSPMRLALANASLAMSGVLGVIALCLVHYAIISAAIALLGLAMAGVSLASLTRVRALIALIVCLLALLWVSVSEYREWVKSQSANQGLTPDDMFDEE